MGVVVDLASGIGSAGDANGDRLTGIERVVGSALGDTMSGSTASDTLEGGDGNDRLDGAGGSDAIFGGSGDDTLIGGAGSDQLDGGTGADTADYTGSTQGVTVYLDGVSSGAGGTAAGDTLINIETVLGSSLNDFLVGAQGNETLIGNDGNDVLEGGGGADRLEGGAGTDTASYEHALSGVSASLATGTG
ncbi:MAG: hypothetical protein VW891_14655, partial [Novosphingobium sp.]